MRELIERLEALDESRGVVIPTKELPPVVKKALKEVGFKKSRISVVPQEKVSLQGFAGGGSRSYAVVLNLASGKYEISRGSWGGGNPYGSRPVDTDSRKYDIPENGMVILGEEGGGQPVTASLYVNPKTVTGFLPGKSDLTERQKSILRMFAYTSAYRKELFDDNNVKDSEVDELVKSGHLKRSKNGALRRTIKGENDAQ
jgi:hypothetical protein